MRLDPKRSFAWFGVYYHRVIALAVFLGLVLSLWILVDRISSKKNEQDAFQRELDALKPQHHAASVDTNLFVEALKALNNPTQIAETTSNLVAELRVSCVFCGKPIPYAATECPFCGARQPEQIREPDSDKDKDGIPDWWEEKQGMNPLDASDAMKDFDRDGFNNLEEFLSGTNPRDAGSHPSPVAKLRVVSIQPLPFVLTFVAVNRVGTNQMFQLNMGSGKRSYFAKLGEDVEGFKLIGFQLKVREENKGGLTRKVDESVLTLQRGDKKIELVKGQKVPHQEYAITLVSLLDNGEIETKVNGAFDLKGAQYQVKDVDTKDGRVLITDASTGKESWIGKKQPSEGLGPSGAKP